MNHLTEKLRLIYIPFLIIAFFVIVGYTYLNWLTMIHLQLFQFKETFVNIIPPFIITSIAVMIWLRPRLKLLNLKSINNRDPKFIYLLIAVFAIVVPTFFAQEYMETATGKLTVLDNISQIDKHAVTKYYALKNYFVDKNDFRIFTTTELIGKNHESLNINVLIVCPLLSSKPAFYEGTGNVNEYSGPLIVIDGKLYPGLDISDIPTEKILSMTVLTSYTAFQFYGENARNGAILLTTNHFIPVSKDMVMKTSIILPDTLKFWLGFKFTENISNRISNEEQKRLINTFRNESMRNFELQDISKFVYLKRLGNSDAIEDYLNAVCKSPLIQSTRIVFLPVNEQFKLRNGNKFEWIFISFGIGALLWLVMILIPKFVAKQE